MDGSETLIRHLVIMANWRLVRVYPDPMAEFQPVLTDDDGTVPQFGRPGRNIIGRPPYRAGNKGRTARDIFVGPHLDDDRPLWSANQSEQVSTLIEFIDDMQRPSRSGSGRDTLA
jgi:hypothetical protein